LTKLKLNDLRIAYRKFTLKHEVKKEYFTILLPVLIASLIVLGSLWMSYSSLISDSSRSSGLEKVREEYMKSVGKVTERTGEIEAGTLIKGEAVSWTRKYFDHIIIWAIIIAILPYSIDSFLERKRRRRYEEEYGEFLFEISELLRSGIDPMKSLIEISKSETKRGVLKLPKAELKALTPLIKNAASKLSIGRSFEDAMMRVAKDTKSKLIEKYAHLVVIATYIGGEVSNIILRASQDLKTNLKIQRDKESDLRQYVVIFYAAHAILIAMLFLINSQLLPFISGVEIGGSTDILFGSGGIRLGGSLENLPLEKYFFHLIMINALIVGLVIGKILHGSIKHGLIHSSVLMIASYVTCVMLILPGGFLAGAGTSVQIEVVSGDNQYGSVLVELSEPVVFNVTQDGKPYTGEVKIVVEGPKGARGRANPDFARPDEKGMLSTRVTLGKERGLYIIRAKAGDAEGLASAYARGYRPEERGR